MEEYDKEAPPLVSLLEESLETYIPNVAMLNIDGGIETVAVLDVFRNQWQEEIREKLTPHEQNSQNETKAKELFLEGVECEKRGDMTEAVHKYKKATKLVPDIEKRVYSAQQTTSISSKKPLLPKQRSRTTSASQSENLLEVFLTRTTSRGANFLPNVPSQPCYLNRIPVELLRSLMKYVVGGNVSTYMTAVLSEVSTMFYVLAREEDLWKLISHRSLGEKRATSLAVTSPLPWRELYFSVPHIKFDGIYLAKITYIRHGETGFQDKHYRPWHTVVYYRLLRFFANGSLLMKTTSDHPQSVSGSMTLPVPKNDTGVLYGRWTHSDTDEVTATVKRVTATVPPLKRPMRNKLNEAPSHGVARQEFQINLGIEQTKHGRWVLTWRRNICNITYFDGTKSTCDMNADTDLQAFPPHRFYVVKSYSEVQDAAPL